jgi:1-phosphofructokinase family hexose kinase
MSTSRTTVLTITPNPSVDFLYEADVLVWDDANRIAQPRRRAGGQGINVARGVRALGGVAACVAPLGGAAGKELEEMLRAEDLPLRTIRIAGETRVFAGVRVRSTGQSLLLNPRGPELSDEEIEDLLNAARASIAELEPVWVACCGSIPPGAADDLYARVARAARKAGARFVADSDGASLRLAAEEGCDLLVPNQHEAERLLGRTLVAEAAVSGALELREKYKCAAVLVTLGAQGAVAAAGEDVWSACPPRVDHGSAVGAGDAFLAAFLVAREAGADVPEALIKAVATGTAVLLGKDAQLFDPADANAIAHEVILQRKI